MHAAHTFHIGPNVPLNKHNHEPLWGLFSQMKGRVKAEARNWAWSLRTLSQSFWLSLTKLKENTALLAEGEICVKLIDLFFFTDCHNLLPRRWWKRTVMRWRKMKLIWWAKNVKCARTVHCAAVCSCSSLNLFSSCPSQNRLHIFVDPLLHTSGIWKSFSMLK